jgi:hypothetical protein
MKCRKCLIEKNNSKFRYKTVLELTEYQRWTCKDCWTGKPFRKAVLKRKSSRKKESALEYFAQKRSQRNANSSLRRAREHQATPLWCDLEEIKRIYQKATQLSKGEDVYHVDHIVPLTSDVVCGLHVPCNLQILKSIENLQKHNKFVPYSSIDG